MPLNPIGGAHHQNGIVQHPQSPFHFPGEVCVSRRVYQVILVFSQRKGRLPGKHSDAPLLLNGVGV